MKSKASLLIADDSQRLRSALKDILIREGFEVAGEAENGVAAVRMYDSLMPSAVIMDVCLQVMDSIETLRTIKAAHPKAKIIVMGAPGQQKMIVEALRAGADGFFTKPPQSARIKETLEKVL